MKRIFHHWSRWECVPAGMYETIAPDGMTPDQAKEAYRLFLADLPRFEAALKRVLSEWPISCEQFLSNEHINRIAWLGQSSMCIETGVPACFRGGFRLLTGEQQEAANRMALKYLNVWLKSHGAKSQSLTALDIEEDEPETLAIADNSMGTITRVNHYILTWLKMGYADGIPDEVPNELQRKLLAPSYKAIAQALLKNDMPLKCLGFVPKYSEYYGMLKRIEISARPLPPEPQLRLF